MVKLTLKGTAKLHSYRIFDVHFYIAWVTDLN